MALPTGCFKLGFNSWLDVYDILEFDRNVSTRLGRLFRFVVSGMKCSYKRLESYQNEGRIDESAVERLPDGTWTGVVGLLNRSEVDYAPAEILMTEERWDAMSYNYPYNIDELVFATRKPEYSPETMALFRTLSSNVWSALLACIVLVTLACFVAMKRRCTLGDILLHVLAIGLDQEGNLVPRKAGEVMLLSTWLGAMAVFTFCFKSVLLSFLTFPPVDGVRTVPELAAAIRAGQYIAFTQYFPNEYATYLLRSENEDLRVIGESMLQNRGNLFEIFDYPLRKAYVHKRSVLQFIGEIAYVSEDNMGSLYLATALSKDFCCKDEIDMLVHRYWAAGMNVKHDRFMYSNLERELTFKFEDWASLFPSVRNIRMSPETKRKLTLTDLSGAFILLVAGHCLSLCVFIVECWAKRRERRRLSPRNKQSGSV